MGRIELGNLQAAIDMGAARWAASTLGFAASVAPMFAADMPIGWWAQLLDDYDRAHRVRDVKRSHVRLRTTRRSTLTFGAEES